MPTVRRLTRASDFAAVRREGRAWSDRLVVLLARRNGLDVSRAGYSVGKRVGNAVTRNKAKRRLREAVRNTAVRVGWDLVFVARKDASSADFHDLNRSVTSLIRRAGVLGSAQEVAPPSSEAR